MLLYKSFGVTYNNVANIDLTNAIKKYVEYSVSNDIPFETNEIQSTDNTLYLHKGNIICLRNHHKTEDVTAVISNIRGRKVKMNISHCLECNKFFMLYDVYMNYRLHYGSLLADIRFLSSGEYNITAGYENEESPLHLCGYNVNQDENLSSNERQQIISLCIDSKIMSKREIINLLTFLINRNGRRKNMGNAIDKWLEDREYTLNYNIDIQKEYEINRIEQYSQNKYYRIK